MRFSFPATRLTAAAFAILTPFSAMAQSVTRTQLVTASPTRLGQAVAMTAEVDALGGGAPTGSVAFADSATALGAAPLSLLGAGQATLTGGENHTCALTSLGGVRCWGANDRGQLGDGTFFSRPRAGAVAGLTSGVVAFAVGAQHSCALTNLGSVKCWGENGYGQLGNGTNVDSMVPVQVSGLGSGVVAIAAGSYHFCALTSTGVVMCWGYGGYGQLGNGESSTAYTPTAIGGPTTVFTAIAAGDNHTCALTTTGGVRCWGSNYDGEVGDGTGIWRSLPVSVFGLSSGVIAVAAHGSHSCAMTIAGALKCWGNNPNGQLGDGSTTDRLAPVQVSGLMSGVAAVELGKRHSCALLQSGAVRCWGDNYKGKLGDGTQTNRLTPWQVSSLGGVAVALTLGDDHTCAVLTSRVTRCWGDNYYGQLGDGTTTDRLLPATTTGFLGLLRARARLVTTALPAGWRLLRASYPGDATHAASSANVPQWVQ